MSVTRALAGLVMFAPLVAGAGCSSAGTSPCTTCDAGKADLRVDRAADYPASEAVPPADAEQEIFLPSLDADDGDTWRAATRDTPAGEAALLTPLPDAGYALAYDFETGEASGWRILGGQDSGASTGDWSVILGNTGSVFSQGALDTDAWHIAYANAAIAPDQIVEAKMRVIDFAAESPLYMAALFGRYDPIADSGYFVALRGDGSMILRRRDHGANASWGAGIAAGIRPGDWHTVRLEIMGGAINAFLDGVSVYSVVDDSPLDGGGIALGGYGATLEVDRIFAAEP